jgi:signal transduction histidine kinase
VDKNGCMARRVRCVFGFLTRSEPRRPLTRWMIACDAGIAAAATVGVLLQLLLKNQPSPFPAGTVFAPITVHWKLAGRPIYAVISHAKIIGFVLGPLNSLTQAPPAPQVPVLALVGIALTAAPLLFRRRFPLASGVVILTATLAAHEYVPPLTFGTALFGAFCAVAYSRYRQLAVAVVLAGAIAATIVFPNTLPHYAERYTALFAMVPTVAVALGIRELRRRLGDSTARLRRVLAEHEADTVRALERERARIAAELHDVVTHNVSVMVVQAGAARKVIASAPRDAEKALLAVEASGRAAMTELRNLLGLLCPDQDDNPAQEDRSARREPTRDDELRPQPGLDGLRALVDRVSAAGLTVRLVVTGKPRELPPGVDLAAYRVVQEGLTNVIRHAGEAGVDVLIEWGAELAITVRDNGRGARNDAKPGRGLIGLRERLALYGGVLDAGPRPRRSGKGWRLRATIPLPVADDDPHWARSAEVRVPA